MRAEIITIGDEILIGQVVDTNSAWLGERLSLAGIQVTRITSIPDEREQIVSALHDAERRSDIVLITGGLGPTRDDITKTTFCEYFEDHLVLNPSVLNQVEEMFRSRGLPMLEVNRQQAMVPSRCKVLNNTMGTAPGMWMEKNGKIFISMPGVPYEMKGIMSGQVIPEFRQHFSLPQIFHATVLTQGIGESFLAAKISEWEDALASEKIKLAYLPRPGQVRLRLTATSQDGKEPKIRVEKKIEELERIIPDYIFGREVFGEGEFTLGQAVGERLRERSATMSVAESCTGGFLAHLITEIAGSSDYFMGSVTAYANKAKEQLLDVKSESLIRFGAVSEEVAMEMAEGAARRFGTDYALSTTGVAGPSGGSETKPVGFVWIGIHTPQGVRAEPMRFGKDRIRNIERMSRAALECLRRELGK
ncbi:MAG: competence/damage-inducible protein A [Bacteroidia bacterium]|nr:competence/damage-inducible protein A [Bacteroidia bacterium]